MLSAVPIGNVAQVDYPAPVAPVVPPGPKAPLPSAPGGVSAGAAGLPAFAEIPVAVGDQGVGLVSQPGTAAGSLALAGTPAGIAAPAGTTGILGRPVMVMSDAMLNPEKFDMAW